MSRTRASARKIGHGDDENKARPTEMSKMSPAIEGLQNPKRCERTMSGSA